MHPNERGYLVGHKLIRERKIRTGELPPLDEAERNWAREGFRENKDLETLRREIDGMDTGRGRVPETGVE